MTKEFYFKTVLPTEKEFEKAEKLEYQLDIPDGFMLNHQVFTPKSFKIDYKIKNKTLILKYKPNRNYPSISKEEISLKGTLVPIQPSLQKKLSYEEDFESVTLRSSVKYFYMLFNDDLIDLNPIYQRGYVWTEQQKNDYILNLFESKAEIRPVVVQYAVKDKNDDVLEILDGKQRLSTLFDFINNKITVNGLYFKDLTNEDQEFIMNHKIDYRRIMNRSNSSNLKLETRLQLFYEINLYGTKMTNEELKEVQKLLINKKESIND